MGGRRRSAHARWTRPTVDRPSGWSQAIGRACEERAFRVLEELIRFEVPCTTHRPTEGIVEFRRSSDGAVHRVLRWRNHAGERYDPWDIELLVPGVEEPIHRFEVKSETPGLSRREHETWRRLGDSGYSVLRVCSGTDRVTLEPVRREVDP